MTKRERVKSAIAHRTPDKVPTFFHLAPDGLQKYGAPLFERYGRADMKRLLEEGRIDYRNALYFSMGNHVCFLENFPWWDWKDLPPEYKTEDTPDFIPEARDFGSLEVFAECVRNLRETTDAYILAEVWTSDFEKAYFSRGLEFFLADMAADPVFSVAFRSRTMSVSVFTTNSSRPASCSIIRQSIKSLMTVSKSSGSRLLPRSS